MRGGSSSIILHTMDRIFWLSLMGCESEIHHWSGPPAFTHCSLRSRRGLGLRQVDRGPGIAPLRRRPHCVRWRPPLCWCSATLGLLTVDRAPHRLPVLSSWIGGTVTPVISSQAPHHRLPSPAPREPFDGTLVAVD